MSVTLRAADPEAAAAAIGELRALGCEVHVIGEDDEGYGPNPGDPVVGVGADSPEGAGEAEERTVRPGTPPLTPREQQILEMIAQGFSTHAICDSLYIAPSTLRSHVRSVFWKLGAHTRVEAVGLALSHGIVDVASRSTTGAPRRGYR